MLRTLCCVPNMLSQYTFTPKMRAPLYTGQVPLQGVHNVCVCLSTTFSIIIIVDLPQDSV